MDDELLEALELEDIETIKSLISKGANINSKDSDDYTLLHWAVIKHNKEAVKVLIDLGIDINLKNDKNETALQLALSDPWCDNSTRSYIVNILVEAGSDVKTTSKFSPGRTALHVAAKVSNVNFIRTLISQGVDVNAADASDNNFTALHCAAANIVSEDPTIFKVLLAAGANVDAQTAKKETALLLMSKRKTRVSLCKIAAVFVEYKADFKLPDSEDESPMDYAISGRNTEVVEAFVVSGGVEVDDFYREGTTMEVTWLGGACEMGVLPTARVLLENGANVNHIDKYGETPLRKIVNKMIRDHYRDEDKNNKSDLELVKYLLENWKPDINVVEATDRELNILTARHNQDLPDCLWKTLLQHVAKMQANDEWIHNSIRKTISKTRIFKDYFEKCKRELDTMKDKQLNSETWVTLFNLLVDDKQKLIKYAGGADFVRSFTQCNVSKNFPIYCEMVLERFAQALTARGTLDQAAQALSSSLPIAVDPSSRIVMKILNYVSMRDMQVLCE